MSALFALRQAQGERSDLAQGERSDLAHGERAWLPLCPHSPFDKLRVSGFIPLMVSLSNHERSGQYSNSLLGVTSVPRTGQV